MPTRLRLSCHALLIIVLVRPHLSCVPGISPAKSDHAFIRLYRILADAPVRVLCDKANEHFVDMLSWGLVGVWGKRWLKMQLGVRPNFGGSGLPPDPRSGCAHECKTWKWRTKYQGNSEAMRCFVLHIHALHFQVLHFHVLQFYVHDAILLSKVTERHVHGSKKVSLQLSPKQSVGDVWIAQLDR